MLKIKNLYFNPFQECCSIAWSETADNQHKEGVIIDPGFYDEDEKNELFGFIRQNAISPISILLTHGHFDHIFGVKECSEEYGIPTYMDPADKVIVENDHLFTKAFGLKAPDISFETRDLRDGDEIVFGAETLITISTPGHTPGGVCFLDRKENVLFSGDTLFAGSIGRTDNKWGDYDLLIKSVMDRIMGLDGSTKVIPGHGPKTTIANEVSENPFLIPFNEPEFDWESEEGIELDGGERK